VTLHDLTTTTVLPDGRQVALGQELTITGWPGRYRWLGWLARDGSLTVYGGRAGKERTRAARPEQVRTVHRKASQYAQALERRRSA